MKKAIAALLLICMLLSLTACGAPASSGPASQPGSDPAAPAVPADSEAGTVPEGGRQMGGDFVRGCSQAIGEFFSPYKQGNLIEYGWPCYEPLAYYKSDDQFYACLADSWQVDNDAHTLTVKLKEGIQFHNGDPLDAQDLVFSLQARIEYGTQTTIGSPSAIEALDDYTVRVTWDDFSLNYEQWVLPQYVYSKETFDEKGLDWILNNMVGTGPYVMDEFIPDVHLKFKRSESYWRDEQPGPDTMTWLYMPEATTQVAAFFNGEIDAIVAGSAEVVDQLEAAGFYGNSGGTASGAQNLAVPMSIDPDDPLSNVDVRRAIFLYGIDWDTAAKILGGALGFHTDAVGLPEMLYYNESIEQTSYDPEKAKQLLADAGYPDGFHTVIYGSTMNPAIATVLQEQLKQIGIEADVETVDYTLINSEYLGAKATSTGIVLTGFMYGATNQTDRFVKHISPTATFGPSAVWTQEIVDLWDATRTARTQEDENNYMYQYIDRLVHTDCEVWPIYNTRSLTFYQDWCHYSDLASGGSAGTDPFEIWMDAH